MASSDQEKAPIYADASGAIRGYDPVAYFTQSRPVRGSPQFTQKDVPGYVLKADGNWPGVLAK
jgi:hypothetical protein